MGWVRNADSKPHPKLWVIRNWSPTSYTVLPAWLSQLSLSHDSRVLSIAARVSRTSVCFGELRVSIWVLMKSRSVKMESLKINWCQCHHAYLPPFPRLSFTEFDFHVIRPILSCGLMIHLHTICRHIVTWRLEWWLASVRKNRECNTRRQSNPRCEVEMQILLSSISDYCSFS